MHEQSLNDQSPGKQVALVMQEIVKKNASRVLELGCGRGFCTNYLAQLMPYVDFVGIDLVEEHIEEARRRAELQKFKRVHFETLDMMHIDELGMQFDVVFAVDSAAHISSGDGRERLCRGIWRVLTNNGICVIIDRFRSDRFAKASPEQQRATELAERALMIEKFATKQEWACATKKASLVHKWSRDFTDQGYEFWVNAWRWMRLLLRFPTLVWLFGNLSPHRAMQTTHILALSCMAHAMRNRGGLEYGMMTFEAKFKQPPF